jgi:hypothetical protein
MAAVNFGSDAAARVRMAEWFHRLADMPGVGYQGSPGVDRRQLRGHDAIPQVSVHTIDGKRRESLSWSGGRGGTSSSTAHELAFQVGQSETTPTLLRRVARALELPGEVSDYHFAIQGCVDELWRRRRAEPELYDEIERLCWLDIRLLEARPSFLSVSQVGGTVYLRVSTIERLISLYEREGFLHEALDVAIRAARLHQGEDRAQQLQKRIAQVEAEDVVHRATAP